MEEKERYVTSIKYKPNLKAIIKKVKLYDKKIHKKKICELSNFKIWIVDGVFIRKNICEDFVNHGQHYFYKFIPKDELWIDKEVVPGEYYFYIEHLLVESRLMASGKPYKIAEEEADEAVKRERKRSIVVRELKSTTKNKTERIEKIHKKLLKVYSKNIKVWLVDGELVRDFFDTNFGGGSHGRVDPFTPKDEIWLDDDISQRERKFILLHELHERRLMQEKNLDYLKAHEAATKKEDFYRHNPKNIDKALKEELKLQV